MSNIKNMIGKTALGLSVLATTNGCIKADNFNYKQQNPIIENTISNTQDKNKYILDFVDDNIDGENHGGKKTYIRHIGNGNPNYGNNYGNVVENSLGETIIILNDDKTKESTMELGILDEKVHEYPLFINEFSSAQLNSYLNYNGLNYGDKQRKVLETYADIKTLEYLQDEINSKGGLEQIDNIKETLNFINKKIFLLGDPNYDITKELMENNWPFPTDNNFDINGNEYMFLIDRTKLQNANQTVNRDLSKLVPDLNRMIDGVKGDFQKRYKDIDFDDEILTQPYVNYNNI